MEGVRLIHLIKLIRIFTLRLIKFTYQLIINYSKENNKHCVFDVFEKRTTRRIGRRTKRTPDKEDARTKRTPGRSNAEEEDARTGKAVGSG